MATAQSTGIKSPRPAKPTMRSNVRRYASLSSLRCRRAHRGLGVSPGRVSRPGDFPHRDAIVEAPQGLVGDADQAGGEPDLDPRLDPLEDLVDVDLILGGVDAAGLGEDLGGRPACS